MSDAAEAGGLMGMDSGRFFGFVIGGSVPAALAADWLVVRRPGADEREPVQRTIHRPLTTT
jgi:hypothetical protein